MESILKSIQEQKQILEEFSQDQELLQKIDSAGKLLAQVFASSHKVLSIGNGGSMADAIHFSEELSGKYRNHRRPLAAFAACDAGYLTCVGNDYGFDSVFERYCEAFLQKGDLLFAITTSGKSVNVIKAIEMAKQKEAYVITLTSQKASLEFQNQAHLCLAVPSSTYADRIQELHIKIIHMLIMLVEENLSLS